LLADFETIDASQHAEGQVVRGALIERVAQQRASAAHLSTIECLEPLMDQRFGRALLLCLRAARAIDIGAGSIMIAIEEEHARPKVDGGFEFAREVVVETGDEQMLDARIVFGAVMRRGRARA
jgi:hypothetical protein